MAMDRAGKQLLSLILPFLKVKNWSLSDPPVPGASNYGLAGLLVQLG